MKKNPRSSILMAVDPSLSATGISVFTGGKLTATHLIKPSGENKICQIAFQALDLLERYRPDALAIETQYLSGFGGNSVIKVIEAKGAIEGAYASYARASKRSPLIFNVQPNQAKKHVGVIGTHKRKESKELVAGLVKAMYPELADSKSQDIFDAVAIGLFAWQQFACMLLAEELSTE